MAEIMSIGMVLFTLFIVSKFFGLMGRICGLNELTGTLGASYIVGSGTFNAERP